MDGLDEHSSENKCLSQTLMSNVLYMTKQVLSSGIQFKPLV